jgi:Ni/Co efflux regulator RcnB
MNQSVQATQEAGKAMSKHLDLKDAMRSVATAVGLNITDIADRLARYVTGVSKDEEEALKRLQEVSDQTTEATKKAGFDKLNSQQQYKLLLQQIGQLEDSIANNLGKTTKDQIVLEDQKKELILKQAAAAMLLASITDKQWAENLADYQKTKELVQGDKDRAAATDRRIMAEEKAWLTESYSLDKKLEEQRRAKISDEEKVVALQQDIAGYQKQQAGFSKDDNEWKKAQVAINTANAEIETTRAKIAEQTLAIEKTITAEKQKQVSIGTVGRGDKDLTDRELERKVANIRKDIFNAQLNGGGGDIGSNLFLEAQKGNLQQTLGELNLRKRVRQTAATQGENAAFNQFGGLTEQRFADILRGATDTSKLTAAIDKLSVKLDQPLKTIDVTAKGPFG